MEDKRDFSLYVHIPYCISKCAYCDFYSKPCTSVDEAYIDCLLKEIRFYAAKYGIKSWETVYIGGGTPSLMKESQISRLLKGIKTAVPEGVNGEVTMEMNPETVTAGKVRSFAENGGNRISLGVQSLTESALKAVERHCTVEKALEGIKTVRENFSGSLNLDAIAGLPDQTDEEFLSSLEKIISFHPDHVSLYTLTLEENTKLYRKVLKNPSLFSQDKADSQWLKGRKLLLDKGYSQYEVSNFAVKGFESRHNMRYWQQENYIGAGSGAAGTVWNEDGTGFRWTDTENTAAYLKFWSNAETDSNEISLEAENIDLETREFEFLMMGLRTLRGVSGKNYESLFKTLSPWNGNLLKRLENGKNMWSTLCSEGKARCQADERGCLWYSMTEEGLLFLDPYLIDLC